MNRVPFMQLKLLLAVIILMLFQINTFSQFKTLSTKHDSIDYELVDFIYNAGFTKITYYFDEVTENVGTYSYYPTLKLSKKHTAVFVADVPSRPSEYNFVIIADRDKMAIVDTLGPYYDSYVDALDAKFIGTNLVGLKVRFKEAQEYEDPYFLIIEYKRIKSQLKEVRTYKKYIN